MKWPTFTSLPPLLRTNTHEWSQTCLPIEMIMGFTPQERKRERERMRDREGERERERERERDLLGQ